MQPLTVEHLVHELKGLEVDPSRPVLVHCSLSAIGYVANGASTFLDALAGALPAEATVVMPAFTPQLNFPRFSDRVSLEGSDVSEAAKAVRFDPAHSPCGKRIGAIAEAFRSRPGVSRSLHPHTSFSASGPRAASIIQHHALDFRLGPQSPLGRMLDLDSQILMVGTPWTTCTALHLAEYCTPYRGRKKGLWRVPLPKSIDGMPTVWKEVEELLVWEGDFDQLGKDYENHCQGLSRNSAPLKIGQADTKLLNFADLHEFASDWFAEHRNFIGWQAPQEWNGVTEWT